MCFFFYVSFCICRDECLQLQMEILDLNNYSIPHPGYPDKETFPIKDFNLQITFAYTAFG